MCGARLYPLCPLGDKQYNYNDWFGDTYNKYMANTFCHGGALAYAIRCFKGKAIAIG
jgi:hypothetical protein